MDLGKDKPSVYDMSIEELDKVLNKLTDIELELSVRDEPDNGIMRMKWRLLAENALIYAEAVRYNLVRCVRSVRLRRYLKYIEKNEIDETRYSFSDWEKEHIKGYGGKMNFDKIRRCSNGGTLELSKDPTDQKIKMFAEKYYKAKGIVYEELYHIVCTHEENKSHGAFGRTLEEAVEKWNKEE